MKSSNLQYFGEKDDSVDFKLVQQVEIPLRINQGKLKMSEDNNCNFHCRLGRQPETLHSIDSADHICLRPNGNGWVVAGSEFIPDYSTPISS
jgi:hypothetical protein